MEKIRNFTPHDICLEGFQPIPSEGIARCKEIVDVVGKFAGVDIIKKSFGEIEGLPEAEKDTIFVVSIIIAQESNRLDLVVPGEVIRDEKGRITGCKNLARV
jgi:hypothetical protein